MTQKLSNLNIVLGYWNENMNQNFRFNNPKQCSNWIILVSFYLSCRVIKNAIFIFFICSMILSYFLLNTQNDWFREKTIVQAFVVIHKISKIVNFTRDSLENYNDSEHGVKTKNAPFFMNVPNIYKLWIFTAFMFSL